MVKSFNHIMSLDKYDTFALNHLSNHIWILTAEWKDKNLCNHMHFIASSNNKEELIVWTDINNIKIDEDEFKKHSHSREDMEN